MIFCGYSQTIIKESYSVKIVCFFAVILHRSKCRGRVPPRSSGNTSPCSDLPQSISLLARSTLGTLKNNKTTDQTCIFISSKRSLEQGISVFTSVCLSIGRGGVVMSLPVMDSTLPLQYGVRWKSGRYASYWNALFYLVSNLFIVISITDRMGGSPILMGLAYFDSFTKYYVATSRHQAMVVYLGMPFASADPMERPPPPSPSPISFIFMQFSRKEMAK